MFLCQLSHISPVENFYIRIYEAYKFGEGENQINFNFYLKY